MEKKGEEEEEETLPFYDVIQLSGRCIQYTHSLLQCIQCVEEHMIICILATAKAAFATTVHIENFAQVCELTALHYYFILLRKL